MPQRSLLVAWIVAFSPVACGGGARQLPIVASAPPSASATPAPAPAAPQPQPPVFYLADGDLFRVNADGSSPTPLHLDFGGATSGGAVGVGSGGPVLSPDRRWLAFVRDRDLWVTRTDAPAPQPITRHNPKGGKVGAEVLIAGFSPDGTRLLFHVDEIHCLDDCPPLPKGVTPGFELLELASMKRTPLPKVEGVDAFAADGRSVLHDKYLAASSYELRSYSLVDGSSRPLRTSKAPYGFSQLVVEGDRIAIVEEGAVVMGPVEGTTWTALTPKAPFAELQRPRFAPGGAHLAYARHLKGRVSIEVVSTSKPGAPQTVCADCDARWHDATHLVVADAKGLRLVGLDGASITLAPKGALLAIGRE